jgi:hypothetical protein
MKIIDLQIDEEGKLGVHAISFVEKPAIESEWVYLNSEEVKLQSVNEERRMVYGAALIPNKPIYRVRPDGEEYYIRFSEEVIRKTAYRFFEKNHNNNATLEHESDVEGVHFVESWIKESDNDKSVHLGIDVPIGTWIVGGYVESDELWGKVKLGEVKGFSIEGLYSESISADLEMQELLKAMQEAVKLLG